MVPEISVSPVANFEHFFHSAKDLFCIAGFDGFFKKVNPMVLETLGYTEEELYARPINSFVYEEDKIVTAQKRENLREAVLLLNFENRYVAKNGDHIWLSWTSVPIPELQQVFAVAKNITYKRALEQDRNRMFRELQRQHQELKDLVYTVLHDLRSPAANVVSIFGLFPELADPTEEYRESVGLLKLTVTDLKKKLDDQLDLIITNKPIASAMQYLAFETSLQRTTNMLKALISDSGAEILTDFSEAENIWFNSLFLDSLFLNLISNSIKYARQQVTPVIRISSELNNGQVRLIFRDNGRGFDMEEFGSRIFQLRERLHVHEDSKGVGLYLIRNHMLNCGGDIEVDSVPGQGTTFTIAFKHE